MDTEWWLSPFDKHMEESYCECKTQRDVLGKLNEIIERNADKIIIHLKVMEFMVVTIR